MEFDFFVFQTIAFLGHRHQDVTAFGSSRSPASSSSAAISPPLSSLCSCIIAFGTSIPNHTQRAVRTDGLSSRFHSPGRFVMVLRSDTDPCWYVVAKVINNTKWPMDLCRTLFEYVKLALTISLSSGSHLLLIVVEGYQQFSFKEYLLLWSIFLRIWVRDLMY